ncbi:AAA family ATPase [Labedaea rhizosphaerae]|uniref:Helix-turn-helix protein n=1 Tax=Labedaea rhizosphaerae TaxID=598644 RepID=A0A4R6SHV9_LABRH|nr:AAA family ATPase [Labedaea rhizosphaerae]TDQ00538.1 helix-turn-helix protein [Labedaea rhizosphaerae]
MPITDSAATFGAVLGRLRRAAGLTQEELAERCGLSVRGVGNLERGARRPRKFTVELLADGLGLIGEDRSALFEAARVAHQSAVRDRAPRPVTGLVGRDSALACVVEHLSGSGAPMLLVTGAAGIGKSSLLAEAATLAAAAGMTVLRAEHERFGDVPYAPVVDAVVAHMRALPEPVSCAPSEDRAWPVMPSHRTRMADAVTRFLIGARGPHGLLLVLDDLHRAGPDGLELVAEVTKAGHPHGIRVIAAYRDGEVPADGPLADLVDGLLRADLVGHCPLGPLAAPAADALVRQAAGTDDLPPDAVQRALRLAGGLPLYLVHLGKALADQDAGSGGLPWSLTCLVRKQISALPTATADLLTLLAVGTGRLGVNRLAAAMACPVADLPALLAPARAARLLDETDDGVRLTHELVAEVIQADLGPTRRHALRQRLAETASTPPVSRGTLPAYPVNQARDVERVYTAVREATAQAAAGRHLAELVDLLDRVDRGCVATDNAADAEEALATALAAAGRYDEALATAERALLAHRRHGNSDREQLLTARIGHLHALRGSPREGLARLATAFADGDGAPSLPAQLHLAKAANLYQSARHREARDECSRSIAAATKHQDDRAIAAGPLWRGRAARLLSDNTNALADLHAAASLAELSGDTDTLVRALTGVAVIAHYRGELTRADQQYLRILTLAEQHGDQEVLSRAVCNAGASALWLGDWKAAYERFDRARLLGSGGPALCEGWALVCRGTLMIAAGGFETVVPDLHRAIAIGRATGNLDLVRNATATVAEGELRRGAGERAMRLLLPVLDPTDEQDWQVTDMLPVVAEACLVAGRHAEAERFAADAVRRAESVDHLLALTDALRVTALVRAELGQRGEAAEALDEALTLAERMGSPPLEARVRAAWAHVARSQGRATTAERERDKATRLFTALRADLRTAV